MGPLPRGHWAMSGGVFGGHYWHAQVAAKYSTINRTLTGQRIIWPNVEVETLSEWVALIILVFIFTFFLSSLVI